MSFIQGLNSELSDLSLKVYKLGQFFNSVEFSKLSDEHRSALHRQYAAMTEYEEVLKLRVGMAKSQT